VKHPGRPTVAGKYPRTPLQDVQQDVRHVAPMHPAEQLASVLEETIVEAAVPPWGGWFQGVRDFDECGTATIAAAAGLVEIVTYRVPDAYNGVLLKVGADAEALDAWCELTWFVRRDTATALRYPAVGQVFGMREDQMRSTYVLLNGGQKIGLFASTAGADRVVYGSVKGYIWPARLGEEL